MDFKQISDFFGGTLFPEEYRIDFHDADRRIRDLESKQSRSSNATDRASVLLLRAVHSAMSGDFSRANQCLNQISQLPDSGFDASWPCRRSAYEFYVSCLERVPPTLRFWTGRSNQSGSLRDFELSVDERRRLQIHQQGLVRSQVQNQLDKLEFNVIYDFAGFHPKVWMQAFEHHPEYPDHALAILFEGSEPCSSATIDTAENLRFPKTAAYLKRLNVQYLLAGGSERASSALRDLNNLYVQQEDLIGEAGTKLIQGDGHLSLPFTSPIALNLMPHGRDLGWSNDAWDSKEANFSLRRSDLAISCYTEAFHLYEAVNAKGGMGAVHLRYACIDHAEAIEAKRAGNLESVAQLQISAREHLQEAQKLFQEDVTHSQIVSGHLLMLNISSGNHTDILDQAYEIGARCRETQNIGVSHFIGMLLLRLGHKFSTFGTEISSALLCCYCAQTCFHAVRDPYLKLSSVVALALFQQANGNLPAAIRHIQHGRGMLNQVVNHFDTLLNRTMDQDQRQTLTLMRVNCIESFNRPARSISNSSMNTVQSSRDHSDTLLGSSPLESMLKAMPVGPDTERLRDVLLSGTRLIESLRRDFEKARESHRDVLRLSADIDAAENHLKEALSRIEAFKFPVRSSEVDLMQVVILQQLGEFERARRIVPLTMPQMFGGQGGNIPLSGDLSPDLARLMSDKHKNDARISIALCFIAKDWELGGRVLQRAEQMIPTFFNEVRNSSAPDGWFEMVWIACIHEHLGRLGDAFEWFMDAFRVVELNHNRLADINDRRDLFATIHSGELFFGLARVALSLSKSPNRDKLVRRLDQWQLTPAEWEQEAVRFLELGHSRALLDLLIVEKIVEEADRNQLKKWLEYSYQLRENEVLASAASPQPNHDAEFFGADNDTKDEYLKKVNANLESDRDPISLAKLIPEVERTTELNKAIYNTIPKNAVAVHINISRDGLLILCISSDGIEHIYQANITNIEIERHVLRYLKLFRHVEKATDLPPLATCQSLIEPISNIIITPISKFLKDREHVIFIPSRSLIKFPFSALILDEQPIFLTKDISICPSLASLHYLARNIRNSERGVGVVFNDDPDGLPLNISASAAIRIARQFDSAPLPTSVVTHEDFTQLYEASDVVLIATHGIQHPKSAWQSSLALQPPFRVLDLSRLRSHAALVVFEACVSGLGEETVGNDMLGFSHTVLSSGASAFLGALWSVSDEASALLMVYFFRALKNSNGSESIARCWHTAQVQLYNADSQSAMATLWGIIKQCKAAKELGFVSSALYERFRRSLRALIDLIETEGTPYKHPFFWAPFVVVGHGGLLI